ncbi:hypothetical protein ACFLYF_01200 [Chloroflexota bacterium]
MDWNYAKLLLHSRMALRLSNGLTSFPRHLFQKGIIQGDVGYFPSLGP